MKSFFSRIKDKLKDEHGGGRYFSAILAECLTEDRRLIERLFSKTVAESAVPSTEWPFSSSDRSRYADIALLEPKSAKPLALIEVKYDDGRAVGNEIQITDYLKASGKYGCPFLYLTRWPPPTRDLSRIQKAGHRHMLYADLYAEVQNFADNCGCTRLLSDFLREDGHVFETKFDDDAIRLLMAKSMFDHRHGLGRRLNTFDRMARQVPQTFQVLLSNMRVIGDLFHERNGKGLFSTRPTVSFGFDPWFDRKGLARYIDKNSADIEIQLPTRLVKGGSFNVCAISAISGVRKWTAIEIGYLFSLDRPDKGVKATRTNLELYASVYCPGGGYCWSRGVSHPVERTEMLRVLQKCTAVAVRRVLKGNIPTDCRRKLNKLAAKLA